jgi:hypothetical protein
MAERKFADVSVVVYEAGPPSLVVVGWTFEDSTIPLSRYTISIRRGESPEGLENIVSDLPAEMYTEFEDRTARLLDLHRVYHYQIIAKNKKTGIEVISKIQTWHGDLDIVGMYIVTEHNFKFRHISGVPVVMYKKHTDDVAKCPDCWDYIAKRVTRSSCTTCHGTGNVGKGVGGYYNPTYTWADPNPAPEVIQVTQWGRVQPMETDLFMSNYPRLDVGDLVIELLTERRWKVKMVQDTEKRRTKMLQIVRLDMVDRNEIEYHIPIPEDLRRRATLELNATKKVLEF